jgi:hypothetical protein
MALTKILGLGLLLTAACGGSSSGGTDAPDAGGTNEGGVTDAGGCGLAFSWKMDGPTCQAWLEQNCCTQARACASDSTCSSFVACINACPIPRQDGCITACGGMPPAAFNALGACSKQTPPVVATEIPDQCEWP